MPDDDFENEKTLVEEQKQREMEEKKQKKREQKREIVAKNKNLSK